MFRRILLSLAIFAIPFTTHAIVVGISPSYKELNVTKGTTLLVETEISRPEVAGAVPFDIELVDTELPVTLTLVGDAVLPDGEQRATFQYELMVGDLERGEYELAVNFIPVVGDNGLSIRLGLTQQVLLRVNERLSTDENSIENLVRFVSRNAFFSVVLLVFLGISLAGAILVYKVAFDKK